jgi:hypothetical protein
MGCAIDSIREVRQANGRGEIAIASTSVALSLGLPI